MTKVDKDVTLYKKRFSALFIVCPSLFTAIYKLGDIIVQVNGAGEHATDRSGARRRGTRAGGGTGAGAGGGVAGLPAAPRQATAAPPRARQPLPASAGSNVTMPATSYRVGYADYLRTAGVSQIAALALPGLAGLLVLTGAGGLVGYRQAKAGHVVRPSGVARFMNQPGS